MGIPISIDRLNFILKIYDKFKNKNINRIWKPILNSLFYYSNLSLSKNYPDIPAAFKKNLNDSIKIKGRSNFKIYSLIKTNSQILMRFKRIKINEFNKHFNINKTNRVVGFTPDFVGSSKSKTVKAKNFLLEFISCNFNTISDSVSDSCKNDLYDSINS